jgi:hypothetical protein
MPDRAARDGAAPDWSVPHPQSPPPANCSRERGRSRSRYEEHPAASDGAPSPPAPLAPRSGPAGAPPPGPLPPQTAAGEGESFIAARQALRHPTLPQGFWGRVGE